MTLALRSRLMRPPSWGSTGASLARMLPPPCPSVVEEASSSCSAHRRRSRLRSAALVAHVAHDARHLDLVHGVDHAGGGARLAELVAHVGHVADARALAAQRARHHDAEQPLRLDGGKRLGRETGATVDIRGTVPRPPRRPPCARVIKSPTAASATPAAVPAIDCASINETPGLVFLLDRR